MKKINSKWIVWLVFGFAYMIGFFHRYAIGVIADTLTIEMGLTPASLSLLASLYFYTYGILQIPTGIMLDAHGPRKVVIVGMGAIFVGSLLFAASTRLMVVYVARVFIGFGAATTFTSVLKTVALWFKPNEFATLSGLTSVLGNTGAILATSPFVFAIALMGWRGAYVLMAVLTLVLLAVMVLFVQDRPSTPDQKEGATPKISLLEGLKTVSGSKYTWLNIVILFSVFGSYMSFTGLWGPSYLTTTYGMTLEEASAFIMVFLTGTIAGAPLVGWVSDRVGRRKRVLQIGLSLLATFWAIFLYILPLFYSPAFLILLLFLMGCTSISPMLCFTNVKELNQKKYVGIATGFVNSAPFFGTAILNSVVAWFLRSSALAQNYQNGVQVYLVVCLLAFGASFFMKEAIPSGAN